MPWQYESYMASEHVAVETPDICDVFNLVGSQSSVCWPLIDETRVWQNFCEQFSINVSRRYFVRILVRLNGRVYETAIV